MQDVAKLSDLAAAEIDELTSAGVNLSPTEVIEINALAWQVESSHTRLHLSRGVPVEIGGAWLWPLSLYGQEFFDRVGSHLGGNRICTYAIAYVMANQYNEGEPLNMIDPKRTIKAWASKLRCRFSQLIIAISQVLQQDEEPEMPNNPDAKGMTIGDFSAFLSSVAGATPDFWERRCAVSYTHSVLTTIMMQNRADDKPCAGDPRIEATRALGYAIDKIRKRRGVSDV